MSLISLNKVSLHYGNNVLLDEADLHIADGDSLALVGRNGCGKTTLLKIIAGLTEVDGGFVERQKNLKIAYLKQDVPTDLRGSVFSVVASGLGEIGEIICKYRELLPKVESKTLDDVHADFDRLVHRIGELDAWNVESQISEIVAKLELDATLRVEDISAGLKRRVLLGRELAANPDLLLLDEPTNHLDIDSVVWLEKFLKSCGKTLVFVSHDRIFLQNLATRVVEVDRAKLISFDCDFKTFTIRRDELLAAQERNDAVFDKKLAQEEAWLRQGIKARRTRNEGRVKELMRLRKVRQARRNRAGSVSLNLTDAAESGEKVLDVKNISVSFSGNTIIKNFSTTIFKGDKIGIIGRNGVGKTTLLNALLGRLRLDSGSVENGTRLQIMYFDQLREKLDEKTTLFDFVGEGSDFVLVGGARQPVMGYLQNFLFSAEQIHGEISMLSGGEKNRLLLAKLFTNPANVLVLDEPTNDLDMQTIEILEQALVSFQGTILLVSHDRAFLNNIVTGVFCFENNGEIIELVGGYDQWDNYRNAKLAAAKPEVKIEKPKKAPPVKREKFTNKERAELESLPEKISKIEMEIKKLSDDLQNPDFIRENLSQLVKINERLEELQREDEVAFERWSELEERRIQLGGQ